MDVLSSQANLAGYRAVIESIYEFEKAMDFERKPRETQGCTRMHAFDSKTCVEKSTAVIIVRIGSCR